MTKRIIAAAFVFAAALCSTMPDAGGAGRGRLTIATVPVPGGVIIDGKRIGDAPITVSLEGGHEISFAEYGPQYAPPDPIKVRIGEGDSTTVTVRYRNRFVPIRIPEGFSPADSVRVYGTKERSLRDGAIFDYINGGAIVYLRHGLRETTHAVWRNAAGTTLTLDIFDMGTPAGAEAGFNDDEICPDGFGRPDVGAPGKSYRYEPDYFLYFHKSNFLVYVATNNDSLKTTVESFAASVCGSIPSRENER